MFLTSQREGTRYSEGCHRGELKCAEADQAEAE